MALGKNNKTDGKAYSLKLKLKDGDDFLENAYFDLRTKQGEKYASTRGEALAAIAGSEDVIRDVAGDLVSVETHIGEYEGEPIRSFKLGIKDMEKDELYYIEIGLGSSLGRSIANGVLNLPSGGNVSLGCYSQAPSKRDGKVYPAVSLRQNNSRETIKWKYDPKAPDTEMPNFEEFKGKGGKMQRDYTKQEDFFVAKLNEFSKVVAGWKTAPSATRQEPVYAATLSETNGEDAPF